MSIRGAVAACILLAGPIAGGAKAEPVYKDRERAASVGGEAGWYSGERGQRHGGRGPARRLDSGPGYVGSDYGLGKPAFTGLGSRPDWGRSE